MSITDIDDGDVLTGAIWQTIIDTVENTTSGHDHDGSDSKKVTFGNLVNYPLMHHGDVSKLVNGGTEAELDTHTFSANDFATTDECFIKIHVQETEASARTFKIRFTDGTTTVDTSYSLGGTGQQEITGWFSIATITSVGNKNAHCGSLISDYYDGTEHATMLPTSTTTMTEANWITTAWTISIRSTSAGLYWKWWIYKIAGT